MPDSGFRVLVFGSLCVLGFRFLGLGVLSLGF